jgi:hypothetical protein
MSDIKEFTIQVKADAWATTDMTVGPTYGKVRYDKMPIQSTNPLRFAHEKLFLENTVIGLMKAAYYDGYTERESELRTQLADATRKLEEARKENRGVFPHLNMCGGSYELWFSVMRDGLVTPLAGPYKVPSEVVSLIRDQAIEQGKGGGDASPTDAMELPIPERREHVFKEDKQGIRCTRCGQHAWRADSNCTPNLLD